MDIEDMLLVKAAGASVLISMTIGMVTAIVENMSTVALSSFGSLVLYAFLTAIFYRSVKKGEELRKYERAILGLIIALSFVPVNISGILL